MFGRLRDDSPEEAVERGDVVAGLAFAAGVALGLAAGRDELRDLDVLEALVWIFLTGLTLGFVLYWIVGWALAFVVQRLGSEGPKRRVRHVLAYSFAPLVFALPLWLIWSPLLAVLAGSSLALLLMGLREVYGWTSARAGAAILLTGVWLAALSVCLLSVLALLGRLGE
jgi:Yip1 domain